MDTVRVLAADAVEKVGNGHPGTAMSLAPAAYLSFQKLMRHDPANPDWLGRDAPAGTSPFDHTLWVIASDGDLQEGVICEASSLAGYQELGNLVVIYDENHISIEGDTDVAFTEDILARYEAYG